MTDLSSMRFGECADTAKVDGRLRAGNGDSYAIYHVSPPFALLEHLSVLLSLTCALVPTGIRIP
jgi:hypothetical protein